MTLWRGDGLRVVELGSGISAAYAARLLADFGADVIKVEPPVGDETRRAGPFVGDIPDSEASGLFLYLNFNKRSVTLDLTRNDDAARLAEVLADADALIENLGAGRLDALPLPAGWAHPRLIICSLSGYGQDGPKAAYVAGEISAYAAGGMMEITGDAGREPLKHGLNQAAHLAGVNAAAAVLAASLGVRRTGRGGRIDISEQEVIAQTILPALNLYSHAGAVMTRAPSGITSLVNSSPMPTRDGYIMPSYAGFAEWEALAAMLDIPELVEERFLTPQGRLRHAAEIDRLVEPVFARMSKHDLFHTGQEWRFTFTAVQTAADLAACPHLAERGYFVEQSHPVAGRVRMPGMVPFASAVSRAPVASAPLLGQHNDDIADCGLRIADSGTGIAAETIPQSAICNPQSDLPLRGIRILELGMVWVLPSAVTPLAALGADVIKVEAATRPDLMRGTLAPDNEAREDFYNHGSLYQTLNRNKRGIAIDLTTARGRELCLRLAAISDVVAENFTPRVLHNLGLDYERLRAVNPGVILLSSSGFGQTGPWRNYRAYGPNTEAVDGLMHLTGYPDGPPVRGGAGGLGVAFTDAAGGYFGAYAILAALEQRERSGRGQWLDLSHYEAGVATIPEAVLDFMMNGRVQERIGNRHPQRAPQGVYPCRPLPRPLPRCAGEGSPGLPGLIAPPLSRVSGGGAGGGGASWIAISVATDQQFAALAHVLGLEHDGRFATMAGRHQHHDALDAAIAGATRSWGAAELERDLQAVGVEAAVVATARDLFFDAQLRHRGFFEPVPPPAAAPEIGARLHIRPAWRMSAAGAGTRHRAPEFAEHTDAVLRDDLGLTDEDVAGLEAEGVIARVPAASALARGGVMDLPALLQAGKLSAIDPEYRARLAGR